MIFCADPGDVLDISQLDATSDTPIVPPWIRPPTIPLIRPRIPTREPYPLPPESRPRDLLIEVPDRTPNVRLEERLRQHRYKRKLQRHDGRNCTTMLLITSTLL